MNIKNRVHAKRVRLKTERQREAWIQAAITRLKEAAYEFTAAVESIHGAGLYLPKRKRAKS